MIFQSSFQEMLEEMRLADDLGFWVEIGLPSTIEEYIQIRNDHAEGKNLPKGWIPASTYWLTENGICIGEVNIRHELTEHLRNVGGQIGYWIRPSMRKRGYGKDILRLALLQAKVLGLSKVIVTCDETNIPSKKIIEANGGVFERSQDMGPVLPKKLLYWIELK